MAIQKMIKDLVDEGCIRTSNPPYASPVVLVKKMNNEKRLCIDFRAINKVTVRDQYPLPLIDDCILYLSNKKYFSSLDMRAAYHQIAMHRNSIKYTSFVTPLGQYEHVKVLDCQTPPPRSNEIFRKLVDEGRLQFYLDEFLLATETYEEHVALMKEVLEICAARGLELNLKKSVVCAEKITFLGYAVSAEGIALTEDRIKAIKEYPLPRDKKKLLSCLCLFSYWRRFVDIYATLAHPLQKALKEGMDNKITITEEYVKADSLINSPVLIVYNPHRETELHCDASSHASVVACYRRRKVLSIQ